MTRICTIVVGLALAGVMGCSGGGGGSSSIPPSAPWEKFRHDSSNSGQGGGAVVRNPGSIPTPVAILWATTLDNSPISASPAIGLGDLLFIGSEGGTLAALNLSNGTSAWPQFVTSCDACVATPACPDASPALGPLVSSPAAYTPPNNSATGLVVASANGSVYGFQLNGNDAPTCRYCFRPACTDPTVSAASFVSSPNFTINPATSNVAGIFIGATVTDTSGATSGKLYVLNGNGALQWQYPRQGDPTRIGAVTSSPAIGAGNTVYFTTDDGFLYAFTTGSDLLWKTQLAGGSDLPLAPSPVAGASTVITSSANGVILALNSDGSFYWGLDAPSADPGDGFANSLAVGVPAQTPTPTPAVGTPTPASLTPTKTPVPLTTLVTVVGVRSSGRISLINAANGLPIPSVSGADVLAEIAGPVVSSPVLSSDGYIVVGDHAGVLHAISTLDGLEPAPWHWPVTLVPNAQATAQPIRSSAAVDANGVVYIGSDDGYVYAVGTP
jgi:outer membrane protein assembly factor BamB